MGRLGGEGMGAYLELRVGVEGVERHELLLGVLLVQQGVAVREGAALHILRSHDCTIQSHTIDRGV